MLSPKILTILLTACLLQFSPVNARLDSSSGVTYGLSGGRFGDNLLSFTHAAWLSYSLGIPIVYTPFTYSDQLQLSVELKKANHSKHCQLNCAEDYTKLMSDVLSKESKGSLLITLPYFPECPEYDPTFPMANQINWDDPAFIKGLRNLIRPLTAFEGPKLPSDRASVALHIRTGAGFDERKFQEHWPLKSPPMSYYVDSLKILLDVLKRPLYVYIFTDHNNPIELQKTLAKSFSGSDVQFDCRKEENRHDLNVIEDFFAMGKFSCLIRPDSNFSVVASKLFPYQVVISPLHCFQDTKQNILVDRLLLQVGSSEAVSKPVRTVINKYTDVKKANAKDQKKSKKEKRKEEKRKEEEKRKKEEEKRKREEEKRKKEEEKRKHHKKK